MTSSPAAEDGAASSNMSPIHHSPRHRRDASLDTGRKRIPNEQWEAKRSIITQLYHEENKSLKEVMEVLERDYGFCATVKMFKTRVKSWGIDKKLKNQEVFAIMVLKRDRDAAGKASEFTIRGHLVDMDNINRYIRRNPELITRLHAGDRPTTQALLEVHCRTPSPKPLPQLVTSAMLQTATQPQSRHSEVLVLLKEYVEESFYCGRWRWEYDVSCTTRTVNDHSDELFERTLTSLALISRCMARTETTATPLGLMLDPTLTSSPETMLEPALAALRELVAAQSPIFAARMISLLWFLDTHHESGLLQLIIGQLAGIVTEVLGPTHLLAQIWRILASDPAYDYRGLCEAAYATLVPLLEHRIGRANLVTTMLYGDHVDFLVQSVRLDEALALCVDYQARAEATGRLHPWMSQLGILRSAITEAQADINGQIAAIDLGMSMASNNSSNEAMPALQDSEHRATRLLRQGNLAMQAGQPSTASVQYAEAAQILGGSNGDDRLLLTSLANLETAQTRMGDAAAAEGTRATRLRVQSGFAMGTSELAGEQRSTRGSVSSSGEGSSGWSRRRSSGLVDGDANVVAGSGGVGAPSPAGLSGSETRWGWSPDVFVSPNSATMGLNNWQFPPQ